MPMRIIDDELLRRKRELRMRIGRSRRRLNRRLHGVQDVTQRLLSWRTYVVRNPVAALAAALGAGLAASAGWKPGRDWRRLGLLLVRYALRGFRP